MPVGCSDRFGSGPEIYSGEGHRRWLRVDHRRVGRGTLRLDAVSGDTVYAQRHPMRGRVARGRLNNYDTLRAHSAQTSAAVDEYVVVSEQHAATAAWG